jgi:hypothetical protein
MKFKTKVAYSAVLATLSLAAGTAQAAYLSEQGTGQVLIYPYYTVQGGMDTYMSIVNTTSAAKAVKVRFIEGKNSREVLDFNLYLSAYDVWAGAVTATAAAPAGAQLVVPADEFSCTSPQITGAVPFRNGNYAGANGDPYEEDLGRTREGYVEVIEMGVPVGNPADATGKPFAWRITHDQSKTPAKPNDCGWVSTQWAQWGSKSGAPATLTVTAPTGGLIGSGTLINAKTGVDYSYDPVAIEDFSTAINLHHRPGSTSPSLADATANSVVLNGLGSDRRLLTTTWSPAGSLINTSINAVSAVLMRSNVMNEYYVDTDVAGATDWVVTFPTKRFYVGVQTFAAPFTKAYGDAASVISPYYTKGRWNACEDVGLGVYNREELAKGAVDFSPSTSGPQLCNEANVITFGVTPGTGAGVLGSMNLERNLAASDIFAKGWVDLNLTAPGHTLSGNTRSQNTLNGWGSTTGNTYIDTVATYYGLPVVGFAVQKYVNGTFNGAVGNYGGAYIHKYVRTVTGADGL